MSKRKHKSLPADTGTAEQAVTHKVSAPSYYQPHLVTKTTDEAGVITITFIHKQPFSNDTQAAHHVEGFGVFVRDLHTQGYKADAHLASSVDRSGFYHYTQSFKKDSHV